LALLDNMLEKIHIDKQNLNIFTPMNVKLEGTEKLKELYLKLFSRTTKKNLDFETDIGMYKEVCSVYNKLFNVTTKKQTKIKNNGKVESFTIYSINPDKLKYHQELYDFRHTKYAKQDDLPQEKLIGVELMTKNKIIPKAVKKKINPKPVEKEKDQKILKNEIMKVRRPKGFKFENLVK